MVGRAVAAPIITTTTRAKRLGETNSVDYHFVTEEAFNERVIGGEMLEWTTVSGERYGVEIKSIERALANSRIAVVVVTPKGVKALGDWCDREGVIFKSVFVTAPIDVLRRRLNQRRDVASISEVASREASLEEQAEAWRTAAQYDIVSENGAHLSVIQQVVSR